MRDSGSDWLELTFKHAVPATSYAVQKIRLTPGLGLYGRWKQIDAVQLVGE